MVISAKTYEQVALEDPNGHWELDHGCLRQKPGMTAQHDFLMQTLTAELMGQLDRSLFLVYMNTMRLRTSDGSFYVPDVTVVPRASVQAALDLRSTRLDVYTEAMPLVVEVWSRSTGGYDVETKLLEYQLRGDAEIWLLHPYDRTLTAWRLQADGRYTESVHREGVIEPVALPGVRIELAALFEA
jgi:Uma2 family endonuclease